MASRAAFAFWALIFSAAPPTLGEGGPLPGQIMVHPKNPAWLVYNRDADGDGRFDSFFLSGPGDPEDFLYRGARAPNGTRRGDQMRLSEKLEGSGANSIYMQGLRSHGGDGASDHNPFIDSDPAKGLNMEVLDQWEIWFSEMDRAGIVIYLFFYDDNVKVARRLGWPLDTGGNLHLREREFVEALVKRFKHHRHLIWAVAEEVQELGPDYAAHAKRIAEAVRRADDHAHPVAVHKWAGLSFDEFAEDPNIDQFAVQLGGLEAAAMHAAMVRAWQKAAGRYNLNMSEAAGHYTALPKEVRLKSWAAAMGGAYVMVYQMNIADTPRGHLEDAGRLRNFMEAAGSSEMAPHDGLSFAGTQYVLADPGRSYIGYASELDGEMGFRKLPAGLYNLHWLDLASGRVLKQVQTVSGGDTSWPRPKGIGAEAALHVERLSAAPRFQ